MGRCYSYPLLPSLTLSYLILTFIKTFSGYPFQALCKHKGFPLLSGVLMNCVVGTSLLNPRPKDPRNAICPREFIRPSGIRYFVTLVADIRASHIRLSGILALIEQSLLPQIPTLLQLQILQQRRFNIQLNVITLTKSERYHVRT